LSACEGMGASQRLATDPESRRGPQSFELKSILNLKTNFTIGRFREFSKEIRESKN
jgi:hypothetical protein